MNYVIGDIHGCYDALMILLNKLSLNKDDVVYFVGDWVDRAPSIEQGIKCFEWLVNNITSSGQFRSVCGNHDFNKSRSDISRSLNGNIQRDLEDSVFKKLDELPLFYLTKVGDEYNIVTHSWLVNDRFGKVGLHDLDSADIENSVWDRNYSINEQSDNEYRVIHGHTIVCHNLISGNTKYRTPEVLNRVKSFGNNNIDIDCGCFMGLLSGGNLAAYCIDTNEVVYAYSTDDVKSAYQELEENNKFGYKGFQLLPLFNYYEEDVFQCELDWVKEYKEQFDSVYGIDRENSYIVDKALMWYRLSNDGYIIWK